MFVKCVKFIGKQAYSRCVLQNCNVRNRLNINYQFSCVRCLTKLFEDSNDISPEFPVTNIGHWFKYLVSNPPNVNAMKQTSVIIIHVYFT